MNDDIEWKKFINRTDVIKAFSDLLFPLFAIALAILLIDKVYFTLYLLGLVIASVALVIWVVIVIPPPEYWTSKRRANR